MPNINDGTQLGTGEIISNEQIETVASRGSSDLPVTAYKVPRSKIAVGGYGQDVGDASVTTPLQVHSYLERRELEMMKLLARDDAIERIEFSAAEKNRSTSLDVRGKLFDHRGMR